MTSDDTDMVTLYTDGSCLGLHITGTGPGGWAAILQARGGEREISGGVADTTNNRMELTAVIEGLRALKRKVRITIFTDSKYVLNGANEWIHSWKARGWRTAAKKDVKNRDLWEALDAAMAGHEIKWVWVKGHAGTELNERCDKLAKAEAQRIAGKGKT